MRFDPGSGELIEDDTTGSAGASGEPVDEAAASAADEGLDFLLTAAEAAALMSELLGVRISATQFRRQAIRGKVPAPKVTKGTPKWSQRELDAALIPDDADDADEGLLEGEQAPEPKHENVYEFFEQTFSPYYELRDADPAPVKTREAPEVLWCARWWEHKSVVGRLTAAWYAWENAHAAGGAAMSSWILEHGDRHFDRIMAADGTFERCKTGHSERMREYATETAPDALRISDAQHPEQ